MRYLRLSGLIVGCILAGEVIACDVGRNPVREGVLSDLRPGVPNREAARVVGVVTGYGTADRAIEGLAQSTGIATLHVRIDDVVSGRISKGNSDIVVLNHRSDCASVVAARDFLEEHYPVGARIVVFGEVIAPFDSRSSAVLAQVNQGGWAYVVPPNVRRIATGELDFAAQRESAASLGRFMYFEFDRALLMLADAPVAQRFARLRNLASYPYSFHAFRDQDREFYSRLVAESGMTVRQRDQLLKIFDDLP